MITTTYRGTAYRQALDPAAPWIVTFVASAEEILEWAGIPQRREENMQGFQRASDPVRVARAREYFEQPFNQSPTALVVGLHPRLDGDLPSSVVVEFEGDEVDGIRHCTITITALDANAPLDDVVRLVRSQIEARLNADTTEEEGVQEEPELDEDEVLAGFSANDELRDGDGDLGDQIRDDGEAVGLTENVAADDDGDEDIELGRSILNEVLHQLENGDWCTTNAEALRDLAKPATVIDGQHRVKGAQACERNVPFTVCALIDCPWPEQVFQFTVINYTARRIPDQFITANAALSLTKNELEFLGVRLEQAQVRVTEYELMKYVNFDKASPFFGLIDLSEKKTPTRIGYKTMVKVAKRWYDARHPVFDQILVDIYPQIRGKTRRSVRIREWKKGDWGLFFQDFWNAIKAEYETHPSHEGGSYLWEAGHSQLLNAVVLYEVQEAYFNNLNAQDEEFFQTAGPDHIEEMRLKLKKRATKFTEFLPASFFATKWASTSLNTGPGHVMLTATLRQLVDNKGNYKYLQSALVTGQTQ